jgi:hypothetical protein
MYEVIAWISLYIQEHHLEKQMYFRFGIIYLTHTWIKSYNVESRFKKLCAFRKVYMKPTFTMQNLKVDA